MRTYSCHGVRFSWAMIQISELNPYHTVSVINLLSYSLAVESHPPNRAPAMISF